MEPNRNVTFSQIVFRPKNYFQPVIHGVFLMMVKNLRDDRGPLNKQLLP